MLAIVLPIVTLVDAWRFPARAWRVTGQPRWLWALLPVCLLGVAFVPFGDWWFRALLLAADASCVLYLVKVRPMLSSTACSTKGRRGARRRRVNPAHRSS